VARPHVRLTIRGGASGTRHAKFAIRVPIQSLESDQFMATVTETAAPTKPPLPRPQERPLADVVIYDGHCRMCTAQVRAIERLFSGGRLAYLSLHDAEVARRYPDLVHDALMREMYIVDRQGRRHAGAAAVRYLSRRLPRLWWLAPVLHLPGTMPLWSWLYRQVANSRYRFGRVEACDDGSCRIHR
jgi:predicted DCC family thiol-disulfide oxidoreductase YuxK